MTQDGKPADQDQSIDPRYLARRARLDRGLDESVAPPRFSAPGKIPGGPGREAETTHPAAARPRVEAPAGLEVNETRSFAVLRGEKRSILAQQRAGWGEGLPVPPEQLLRRWPTDPATDPDAASLLVEDYFQRRIRGQDPSLGEYQERFPDQSRSLNSMVSRHLAFGQLEGTGPKQVESLRLPDVGDEIFGFRLKYALGKGAFARVFLAVQGELAGRPVVLKVSAIEGTEPQTLAQLQHTNIVPIYSVHEDAEAGLRAVCMPYFGGASLSEVLKEVFAENPAPREGREILKAMEIVQSPPPDTAIAPDGSVNTDRPAASTSGQTPLAMLAGMDYTRAAIWMAAKLAEGLQHAHQRGVLHRDIKPSNILVGSDGQPLLLDFNLAHDLKVDPIHATIGGTIAYMAPEHLTAILRQTTEHVKRVDHRSDIYSLGMVIAEMLTGHNPYEQSASYSAFPLQIEAMAVDRAKGAPSVRAARPDLPWGLESIVRTCLCPDPDLRYQQAEHLAEDLRRLLDDRPLRYAPEVSLSERARKWTRRHPRLTTAGMVAGVASLALITVTAAFLGVRRHLDRAQDRLGTFQARDLLAAHDSGTSEALTLVNTVIDRQDLLRRGLDACEKTLALFDPPKGSPAGVLRGWDRLRPEDRAHVAEDRRELLILSAGGRLLLAPGDPKALRDAVRRLDRAEAIPGLPPSKALWSDRARYLSLLGETAAAEKARQQADRTPARTARDHYLLATSHARRGGPEGFDRAIEELNRALRINPKHYWSQVLRGVCFLEKRDFVAAAGDFGLCAGLRPDLVWGRFNRGYVLERSGRTAEAIEDYDAVIANDPRFAPARINRGMLLLQRGRNAEALADFEAASEPTAAGDPTLRAARGMALEGLGRHREADADFARAFEAYGPESGPTRTRLLWTYGFAVSARLPEKASEAFEEVLRGEPRHAQARYGLAMLEMTRGRIEEAISDLDLAVKVQPDFVEARRYRSIALARSGRWDLASRDVRWCLDRDPASGENLYAAACVSSLAAGKLGTPETYRQSLDLLRRALDRGVGLDKFAADPDLKAIRDLPDFRRLPRRATAPDPSRKTP